MAILLLTVLPKIPSILGTTSGTLLRNLKDHIEAEMENAMLTGTGGKLKLNFHKGTISFYTATGEKKKWEVSCNGILDITEVVTNFGARYSEGVVTIPISSFGIIPKTKITFVEKSSGRELTMEINPFNGKITVVG